jgi:LysM repeat protein
VLLAAIAVVVLSASVGRPHVGSSPATRNGGRRHASYRTVRPGDTLAEISYKTGLSLGQLEAYNPDANPQALVVGERLKLFAHPPLPALAPAKPRGPIFWTVQPGQSYGSIAAATGINMSTLILLNPQLPPSRVQPGEQIKLWPATTLQQAAILARRRLGST